MGDPFIVFIPLVNFFSWKNMPARKGAFPLVPDISSLGARPGSMFTTKIAFKDLDNADATNSRGDGKANDSYSQCLNTCFSIFVILKRLSTVDSDVPHEEHKRPKN
jgi:hypothetical protein